MAEAFRVTAVRGAIALVTAAVTQPSRSTFSTPKTCPKIPSLDARADLQMTTSRGQTPTKRLLVELQSYQTDPNDVLQRLGPVNDDELTHWQAVMKGVPGTAYESGRWLLDIRIPPTYPLAAPEVKFVTPICHPNVHFRTGEICLDTLKAAWSPAFTISTTLTSIHQLLTSAEPDSPLNIDIAQLLRQGDLLGAESLIKFYTETERYEGR